MTKLEKFVELWRSMTVNERVKTLEFLTEWMGLNLLKTCSKLYDRLERKRDKRG